MARDTRQRQAIRQVFEAADRPLSPNEVVSHAQRTVARLGIATVYRTIKDLVEEGWLVAVELPGLPPRYEVGGKHHHHHFHCRGCDATFEVEGCVEAALELRLPKGFHVEGHTVVLQGRCPGCARREPIGSGRHSRVEGDQRRSPATPTARGKPTMKKLQKNRSRRGAAIVEYGLLIAGVTLISAAAVSVFGHKTNDLISAVATILPGAHGDDNGPMTSGKLIETTSAGTGTIELDAATIAANVDTDRLGVNAGMSAAAAVNFGGLILEDSTQP